MSAQAAVDSARAELPLLEAKLALPRLRAGVIPRSRLFVALDRLGDSELTVISGPAGSGKTVLVSSWLAVRTDLAKAWATLDPSDDDPPGCGPTFRTRSIVCDRGSRVPPLPV